MLSSVMVCACVCVGVCVWVYVCVSVCMRSTELDLRASLDRASIQTRNDVDHANLKKVHLGCDENNVYMMLLRTFSTKIFTLRLHALR